MSSLKKFFLQFSHFITGSALVKVLGLVTFPILTRVLTSEQYGILGLVTTTMLLSVAVAKAGLSNGIIRFYQEYKETAEQRVVFSSTVILRGMLLSAVTVVLYLLLFPSIARQLSISQQFMNCFLIMAIYLFIRPINIIVLNLLRVNDKTIFMNVLNFIGRITSIVVSLFLLIYVIRELYGYFIGVIFAECVVSIILFYWFFSNYRLNFKKVSWDLTAKLIKFGAPLLFTELSYLLLSYVDRFMILAYYNESALGLYSAGYNLAMYIADIISFSLAYAVVPIYVDIYGRKGRKETENFIQRCMYYLLILIIPLCFGYFAVSEELFLFLASKKYVTAATFSPIILIGTIILGMNNILNAGLYLKKKSMAILLVMVFAVIINIIMNVILLPRYGLMGAAIASLVSCLASVVLTISLSYRYIAVKIDIKTVVYYLLLSIIMVVVIKNITVTEVWLDLLAKTVVGILIVISGILMKEKEIRVKTMEICKQKHF